MIQASRVRLTQIQFLVVRVVQERRREGICFERKHKEGEDLRGGETRSRIVKLEGKKNDTW